MQGNCAINSEKKPNILQSVLGRMQQADQLSGHGCHSKWSQQLCYAETQANKSQRLI